MSDQLASPPEGGQGAEGANTQVSPPAAPPADANASPPSPPAPPPEPFYKSIKDPTLRGYAEVKGYKQTDGGEFAEALLKSYQNLEKLRGVPQERLLTLPENMEDAEAMKPIYERLGFVAPEKADEYGFVTMEGADPTFAKLAEEAMHKAGVPAKYAKPIAEWWNAYAKEQEGALIKEAEEETALELGRLKGEWAGKYDERLEKGRRVVRHLGFSEEELQAIETVTGAAGLWRRFDAIYDKLGLNEGAFVEGDKKAGGGFAMTPEAAKVKLEELKTNKEWSTRYLNGDKAAAAEMRRLMEIAHPGVVQQ